jgi:hypothetical protein
LATAGESWDAARAWANGQGDRFAEHHRKKSAVSAAVVTAYLEHLRAERVAERKASG